MPSKDRRRRVSSSPLIDPEVCCVVLLAPDQQTYASLSKRVRRRFERNLSVLTKAARMMDVPVFVSSPGAESDQLATYLSGGAGDRHFADGPHSSPWLNPEFVTALAEEDRAAILIGGCWLEYEVLATGLHALAAAYDVYILSDVTPAQDQAAARSSHDRLMLQGARPVVTTQVLHEWSLAAAKDRRVRLMALFKALLQAQTTGERGLAASP